MPDDTKKWVSDAADLEADAARADAGDDDLVYATKIDAIRQLQADGIPDDEIETALGVKIRPADRKGARVATPG